MANTMSTTGSRSTTPTTATRFYPALDIALLKEVLAVNPYESDKNTKEWESIVANVNSTLPDYKNVTLRSCKDWLKTLIKAHQKAEMQSLKASGTAEEYTEREALLTELSNLITEAARVKEVKKDTDNKDQQGKEIREAVMLSLRRPGTIITKDPRNQESSVIKVNKVTLFPQFRVRKENSMFIHSGKAGAPKSSVGTGPIRHPFPNIPAPKIPGCIAARHTLAILGFLGFVSAYAMRINLSVALVAMVNSTRTTNTSEPEECPGILNSTDAHYSTAETYDWDEKIQNRILSSFFYGYTLTQIPGGWLADRFGGKLLFGLGVLCSSILALLTPLAASAGERWLITVKVLDGISQGVTIPAMHAMWGQWAPPLERSKLATFTLAGIDMGVVISFLISGILCSSNFLKGWPSVFYVFGVCGIIWFILWTLLAHDTPAKHPRISHDEQDYIQRSIGPKQKASLSVPLISVFTSLPVWAIIISQFACNWGFYTLITNQPNYLKNILKFDISQSGILSALPHMFRLLTVVLGGQLADYLRMGGYLTTGQTRKLFNSLGLLIPAVSLVLLGYSGCDQVLAIVFICLACGGSGLSASAFNINHLDIAPKYAGVLLGITNCVGTIPGFIGPAVVGILTQNNNTISQWRIVFWICFAIHIVGFVTFIFMASGEEQLWAREDYSSIVNDIDHKDVRYTEGDGPHETSV